jgi:Glycosyl hydrolases family 39
VWWSAAAITVIGVVGWVASTDSMAPGGVRPGVDASQEPGLTLGVTHTQRTVQLAHPDDAVARVRDALAAIGPLQNQHLMGWGTLNPEPSPGDYRFETLDERIEMITALGGEPVLTLCCAPDWMKGGTAGATDWSRIEVAPDPEHFDDFAELAQVVAQRYPQVRHFLVWNEMKGFFDEEANDWDAAGYTDLYNRVFEAVKEVRPDALIGGPYVVFDSWSSAEATSHPSAISGPWGVLDQRPLDVVDHWLENAVGADFIVVDAATTTRDRGLTTTDFEAVEKLAAVTGWVRSRTDLPVWWAELYPETDDPTSPAGDARRAAVMTEALISVARAGADTALVWQPREGSDLDSAAVFTDSSTSEGGRPLPLATMLAAIADDLREHPDLVRTSWDPAEATWNLTTTREVLRWSLDEGVVGPTAGSGG